MQVRHPLTRGVVFTVLVLASAANLSFGQSGGPEQFIDLITDPSQVSKDFSEVLAAQRLALVDTLKQGPQPFTQAGAEAAQQSAAVADDAWLKASGYDFTKATLQQQGVALLSGFLSLPQRVMDANLARVADINRGAPAGTQSYALVDAYEESYLHFLADALGPRLGGVFLDAYQSGRLSKAAALLKKSEVSTSVAKRHFSYPRPFTQPGPPVDLVEDYWVLEDGHSYTATETSYPSGHTNTGQTDALLLAQMLPERFAALVARGDAYGYSRLVLGVHYPLDVIGGRMHAEFMVSHYLNDPAYRKLFDEAKAQLRSALTQGCGVSLAKCAAPAGAFRDPWSSEAARRFHGYTLSYGLPAIGPSDQPAQVPEGAEVLLEGPLPGLSGAQRRALLARTAAPSGAPLDNQQGSWQRLDLIRALGAASEQ